MGSALGYGLFGALSSALAPFAASVSVDAAVAPWGGRLTPRTAGSGSGQLGYDLTAYTAGKPLDVILNGLPDGLINERPDV